MNSGQTFLACQNCKDGVSGTLSVGCVWKIRDENNSVMVNAMPPQHGAFSFSESLFKSEGCSWNCRLLRCSDIQGASWDSMAWLHAQNGCLWGAGTGGCQQSSAQIPPNHWRYPTSVSKGWKLLPAALYLQPWPGSTSPGNLQATAQMVTYFDLDVPGSHLNHETQGEEFSSLLLILASEPTVNYFLCLSKSSDQLETQPQDEVWCLWLQF